MKLSPRQLQVIEGMAAGKTIKAIAIDLGISHNAVNRYLGVAYRKLGVNNCTAACVTAMRMGLIR